MRGFRPIRFVTAAAMVGSCLAFTGGAAVLTAGPAGAATVSNPGPVHVAFAGSLSINGSTPIVISGIAGTADGTVDSAGNISLPQASISFPTFTILLAGAINTPVTIQATADWTGTISPSSGALTLSAPQTAHLDLSGAFPPDTDCPVGPLALSLTTGASGAAQGTPYNNATGIAEIVDGTFPIPPISLSAPNCPDAGQINTLGGLPLAGGVSLADLTATFTPILMVPPNTPAIGLHKSASPSSFSSAGTVITYSYKVTNTGTVDLHSVAVTDPMPGLSPITCANAPTTLTPSTSETCTASYTTTQADVDRGSIANTGTASGTPLDGAAVTNQSTLTIRATKTPAKAVSTVPPPPPAAPVSPITPIAIPVTG